MNFEVLWLFMVFSVKFRGMASLKAAVSNPRKFSLPKAYFTQFIYAAHKHTY